MEPRRDDGDNEVGFYWAAWERKPQWSPVVMTGTTLDEDEEVAQGSLPQWSPVVMTGTTG